MRKLIESTFISLDGDDRISSMPKYVASTTMEATSHPWNATLLEGEAADAVAALKAEPGLFEGLPVTHLELLDVTTFGSGIVVQDYGPRLD